MKEVIILIENLISKYDMDIDLEDMLDLYQKEARISVLKELKSLIQQRIEAFEEY